MILESKNGFRVLCVGASFLRAIESLHIYKDRIELNKEGVLSFPLSAKAYMSRSEYRQIKSTGYELPKNQIFVHRSGKNILIENYETNEVFGKLG